MRESEHEPKIRLGLRGVEEAEKQKDIIVVIDVLRAASTIITALGNGASSIIPTLTVNQASKISKVVPDSLLAGERRGLIIPGFSLGNSPLEYTKKAVRNKNIIFTTTNCTRVLDRCTRTSSPARVFVGAFLNATAVARVVSELSARENTGISLVEAGSSGESTLDDLACGELIKAIIECKGNLQLTSEIRHILDSLLLAILSTTKHGRYLSSIGFEGDIRYCSHLDTADIVPQLLIGAKGYPRIEAFHRAAHSGQTREAR